METQKQILQFCAGDTADQVVSELHVFVRMIDLTVESAAELSAIIARKQIRLGVLAELFEALPGVLGISTMEHWNAECVGWHVSKSGNRFEALQPVAMGLTEIFGGVGPDVARGLALCMDHGSRYLSDHFLQQNRFWGITPSFAFVSEPQTNGVVERFFRTLKEQAIYGRIFNNLEEVRAAVAAFVVTYNEDWRLEKLGFLSPIEYRRTYLQKRAA